MSGIRAEWRRLRQSRTAGRLAPSHNAVLDQARELYAAEEFEQAEEGARFVAAMPPVRGSDHELASWLARALAVTAALTHGRGEEVLPEVEALITDLTRAPGAGPTLQALLLTLRAHRVEILIQTERHEEAEAEARTVLRAAVRLAHLAEVWEVELLTLAKLAAALNAQGRHEEAEAVARGNLPRADERRAGAFHRALASSLNGQGRYEEALAETREPAAAGGRAAGGAVDVLAATALDGLGRRKEAEAAARQAVSACARSLHPAHPRNREARALLARLTAEDPTPE
ncbi:hypothetical protein [Streptomyces sp. TLI_146]|uniref:hypothetical protein n=1 Tax=Streptomyces sp. TLI_146 TaxID=1938858 RepID=UPI00214AE542|nr:hypothetical protein [Streptomyces sp. TLI_146]